MAEARPCRACGLAALQPAGSSPAQRAVCAHCGRCWEDGGYGPEVDTLACPGCPRRGTCEACPTWLCESLSRRHVLRDGEEILIRPLLYGDRFEMATAFFDLSLQSRQRRFFQAPDELDADDLEYLTNLDYRDHFACAALLVDGPVPRGVGVGRYRREAANPAVAEVAVTVLDEFQRRGIGTLLTRTLGEVAVDNGIRTFVNYVLWGNDQAIELLAGEGARVTPDEPGVARIEIDLPVPDAEVDDSFLHRILGTLSALMKRSGADALAATSPRREG